LESIIEGNALYPVTLLKDVDRRLQRLLVDNGILMLRQLLEEGATILTERRRISPSQLLSLRNKSRRILSLGSPIDARDLPAQSNLDPDVF